MRNTDTTSQRKPERKYSMVTISLKDDGSIGSEAFLFAQLLKRLTYNDVAGCAVDKQETDTMITILENIREQLSKQGIAPR